MKKEGIDIKISYCVRDYDKNYILPEGIIKDTTKFLIRSKFTGKGVTKYGYLWLPKLYSLNELMIDNEYARTTFQSNRSSGTTIFISSRLRKPGDRRSRRLDELAYYHKIYRNYDYIKFLKGGDLFLRVIHGINLRLKVNKKQEQLLNQHVGAARWVFNQGLAAQKYNYETTQKFDSYTELANQLPKLKRQEEYSWLKSIDSTCLQQSLRDLLQAFSNFFSSRNGSRKGEIMGFPKFKSKKKARKSFRITNVNDNIRICEMTNDTWNIKLGKLGFFSVYNWRERLKLVWNAKKINNATIYQDSDSNWYVSLSVESEIQTPDVELTNPLGIDLGLKDLAIFSDGQVIASQEITKKYSDKLARLQRKQAKMVKFSKNWYKIDKCIGKLHFKIKMTRKDFHHQLSRYIVNNYDVITMETLSSKDVMQNKRLSKKTADQSWYRLKTFIKYKAEWAGKKFIEVSKWFPSSKTCSCCGQQVQLTLNMRDWSCPNCYVIHNRDLNAATNLKLVSEYFLKNNIMITTKEQFLNKCFAAGTAV
jgi:putative transposase